MRRLNAFLVSGMLITFLIHALTGTIRLFGGNAKALSIIGWICMTFVLGHVIVTTILTVQTLKARKKAKVGYFKENLLFWTRRISGFALLIPLVMHLLIFSSVNKELFRLSVFNKGRMISQVLLVILLALHILSNMSPWLMSLGVKKNKKIFIDVLFVLSVLLLLFAVGFVVYYLRWMRY